MANRETRYGPLNIHPNGTTTREVRPYGHSKYNDEDTVTLDQANEEDANYENQNETTMHRINNMQSEIGASSMREKVRDVLTKGVGSVKKLYFGKGKKKTKKSKKTRRTNKKKGNKKHNKTTRKSRRS